MRLTLDAFIQYLAEYELEKAVQQYRARAGEVVILDAQTFEVLAMANWPLFRSQSQQEKQRRCLAQPHDYGFLRTGLHLQDFS